MALLHLRLHAITQLVPTGKLMILKWKATNSHFVWTRPNYSARMTRSFKKARLQWAEDGRRVYFDEDGEEIDPFKGRNVES